jgi:hypothetical protein
MAHVIVSTNNGLMLDAACGGAIAQMMFSLKCIERAGQGLADRMTGHWKICLHRGHGFQSQV